MLSAAAFFMPSEFLAAVCGSEEVTGAFAPASFEEEVELTSVLCVVCEIEVCGVE